MTSTSETDKTHGHHDPQQCISYLKFVAVIRSGNETEIIRLCHLLRDPGPFIERYVYEHIVTSILDDRIRQVLKSVHCDNLRALMGLIRKPELINDLRLNGKKLSKDQYTELLALDPFINWMRNNLIDITTADRDNYFWDFIIFTFKIDEHIAYSKEAAIKSRRRNLESQMRRQQTLEQKGKKYTKRNIDIPRGYFITPLIDYITEVFCTVDEVLEKGECSAGIIQRIWRGYHIRRNLTSTERILIRTGGDRDHVMLHKAFRVMKKKVRQSISRSITGSGRRYTEASSIGHSPSIVVQRYVRRFLAKKLYTKMRRVVYLKKEKEQRTCARLYSSFDQGGADTESGDEWGMSISHPTDRISKYIRDAVTSSGIKDWKWISNLVKEWDNWTLVVFGGYVIMVILALLQRGVRDMFIIGNASATYDDGKVQVFTGGSDDDHINSPIMSSGESTESENLILSGDTQTCGASLCDSPLDSNTASDGIMKLEYMDLRKEGDSDKGIPRAPPTKASVIYQTFPSPPLSNENNITKSYGEIDDVGTNGEYTANSDGRVQNIQMNHDHKKDVHKEELCLLKKGGRQTHIQVNSNLDPDSFKAKSEEERGATTHGATTHPNEDINKHVRDTVTPSDNDTPIDSDDNVCASYGVPTNDNAIAEHTSSNNECGSNNEYGILCYGYRGYNVTSIGDDGKARNRGESNYGEKDGSDILTHSVNIKWSNLSEIKFANMISTESKDDAHGYHEDTNGEGATLVDGERMSNLDGYREGINGERVILIDGERMPNSSWDSSNDIPTYGYGTTDGILEDTGPSGLLEMLNESDIERTWGDDMAGVNVVSSDTSRATDDYPAGPEDATKEEIMSTFSMSMGNNIVYTWARNTIYVMINGSEGRQFESLTGSTSAIMSKGTRDQTTLSVTDSLNMDRDTINNSVNRETIGKEQTAIRSGEPPNESYGNNGYTRKSSGGTNDNNTNQRMGSSIERKEKSHSTDGRGVLENIGLWQIRILECGRREATGSKLRTCIIDTDRRRYVCTCIVPIMTLNHG